MNVVPSHVLSAGDRLPHGSATGLGGNKWPHKAARPASVFMAVLRPHRSSRPPTHVQLFFRHYEAHTPSASRVEQRLSVYRNHNIQHLVLLTVKVWRYIIVCLTDTVKSMIVVQEVNENI